MFRNFHKLRGSFVNSPPPGRIVLIALVLALTIGSAGQTPLAQAAPASELANFSMTVQNPRTKLRCGETVTYLVMVEVAPSNGAPTPAPAAVGLAKGLSVVNVTVEAESVNKSVGDFVGAVKGTATTKTSVVFDDDLATLGAKFKFKANTPGKTTLYFQGLVGQEYVSDKVEVKVLPCKFKVNTVSKFSVGMTSVGMIDAEIESDESGSFTGTATVNWVTSIICGIVSPIDPGKADLTGTINESGQLVGQITFEPMTSVGGGPCGIGSVDTSNFGTLAPLTLKASSAGVSVYTQAQVVTATNGSFTGTATLVVIPEEENAVSFLPNDHQAGGPVFLGFFGTLLDLH